MEEWCRGHGTEAQSKSHLVVLTLTKKATTLVPLLLLGGIAVPRVDSINALGAMSGEQLDSSSIIDLAVARASTGLSQTRSPSESNVSHLPLNSKH